MRKLRVHATRAAQSQQVQPAPARVMHGSEKHWVSREFAGSDHGVDACHIHLDDAPRSDIHVADFAVPHLALRESDVRPGGLNDGVRKLGEQLVVIWLPRSGDSVPFDSRRIAPAVENREDQRSLARHYWRKAPLPAKRAASPSWCSMRSSWLYFAMRSVRLAEPVLICPAPVATTRSAMNGSSVSPERCDTTEV